MNESSSSAAETAASETASERLARYAAEPVTAEDIETLDELSRYGRKLARQAAEEALATETTAAKPGEAGAAARKVRDAAVEKFNRLSRSVRVTFGLRAKLLADHVARQKRAAKAASQEAEAAADEAAEAAREAAEAERQERRYQFECVLGGFHDIVRRSYGDNEPFHILGVCERWVAERDYETQLKGRPVGELIALLCRDYGVPVAWKDWPREDWVADAEATLPGGVPWPAPATADEPSGAAPPSGPDPPQEAHPFSIFSKWT
jgi:hypothetical protein